MLRRVGRLVEDRAAHGVRQDAPEGEDDAADVDTSGRSTRYLHLLHHQQHPTTGTERVGGFIAETKLVFLSFEPSPLSGVTGQE